VSCYGNPSTIDLGARFADRQVGSTREPYVYRVEWYLRPIDLANAIVTFTMVNADTGVIKILKGIGVGQTDGTAFYQPVAADVDTAGIYRCQYTATYGGSVYVSPWIQSRIIRNVETPPPFPSPPYPYPPRSVSPYLTPPSSAPVFNDEFRSGDPALERRGFLCYSTTTGQAMARLGDVTVGAPNIVGNFYNSSIVDGLLRVQSLTSMHVVKPVTGAPLQIVAHLGDPRMSVDHTCILQACDYAGAIDAISQRVFTGYQAGSQTLSAMLVNQDYQQQRVAVPPADSSAYVFMLDLQISGPPATPAYDWRNAVIEPLTGRLVWIDEAGLDLAPISPIRAGLELVTANKPYSWVEIGFIRAYPAGSWFPL